MMIVCDKKACRVGSRVLFQVAYQGGVPIYGLGKLMEKHIDNIHCTDSGSMTVDVYRR